jgi:VRR-NUC domain
MSLVPENILNCMSAEDRRKYAKGQYTAEEVYQRVAAKDEKQEHNRFMSWLHRRDLDYMHSRTDKPATIQKGISDFHVWRGERHCFIEFKSELGRLSPEQKDFIARQCERGTPILVTQSYIEAGHFVVETLGLEPKEPE